MANDVMFEGKERRIAKIEQCLAEYGLASLEEARALCQEKGFDPYKIVKDVQPIAFENASWAYTLGSAIALKKGVTSASEAAEAIGIGLEAFGFSTSSIGTSTWKILSSIPMYSFTIV